MASIDRDTLRFIEENWDRDTASLALAGAPTGVDMSLALRQIQGLQLARTKIPLWAETPGVLFPQHLSMEQCTCQAVAEYKAKLVSDIFQGRSYTMADLTGGFGVDFHYLSARSCKAIYNEMNGDLCRIAANNLSVMGRVQAIVSNQSAEDFLATHASDYFDLIYIDPARRSAGGGKLVSISQCQPDLTELQSVLLEQAECVMAKLSPMLDISALLRELKAVGTIDIISYQGECKELLVTMQKGCSQEPMLRAVDISAGGQARTVLTGTIAQEHSLPAEYASAEEIQPGTYLYEPYAAYMKSGLFRTLQKQFGARQMAPDSHLFCAANPSEQFPGRGFIIESVLPFDKRSAAKLFSEIRQANIAVRNFPLSVQDIRTKFKIADGGHKYIFCTTDSEQKKVILLTHKA